MSVSRRTKRSTSPDELLARLPDRFLVGRIDGDIGESFRAYVRDLQDWVRQETGPNVDAHGIAAEIMDELGLSIEAWLRRALSV